VHPATQEIRVDGQVIRENRKLYFVVNKPTGVVSTNYDPDGRRRVVDLLPPMTERMFTVGRLDQYSEGLILVTNDGTLAQELAHPKYEVEKTYQVQVAGKLEPEVLEKLRQGLHFADGFAKVVGARIKSEGKNSTSLEIVLNEGRNREIRRLLAKVGHKVLTLKRISLGSLRLKDMAAGDVRRLRPDEVRALRESAQQAVRRGQQAADQATTAGPKRRAAPGNAPSGPPDLEAGAVAADGQMVSPAATSAAQPRRATRRPDKDTLLRVADRRSSRATKGTKKRRPAKSGANEGTLHLRGTSRPVGPHGRPAKKVASRRPGGKPVGSKTVGSKGAGKPTGGKPSGGKPSGGKFNKGFKGKSAARGTRGGGA
jgi:23S rRNA pseudouridine2605 synthase